jgi:hypothetical protein
MYKHSLISKHFVYELLLFGHLYYIDSLVDDPSVFVIYSYFKNVSCSIAAHIPAQKEVFCHVSAVLQHFQDVMLFEHLVVSEVVYHKSLLLVLILETA